LPNRPRRHAWSHRGAIAARPAISTILAVLATLAVASFARAAAPEDPSAPGAVLTDDAHLLTSPERAALQRLLRAKTIESGSALSILLVPRLAHRQTIEDLARRAFGAATPEHPDASAPARVLLVVSTRDRRAAIETGQGPAGIVPEIDARAIIQRLQRLDGAMAHRRLDAALEDAVAAIAASARATAERRRPLPPDPQDAPPSAAPVAAGHRTEPAPDDTGPEQSPDDGQRPGAGSAPKPGPPARRSLMPVAYALAGLVVIGLAIRRRRRLKEAPVTPPRRVPVLPAKIDRKVKSIGDRPRS